MAEKSKVKKTEKKVSKKLQSLVDEISKLSVVELSELVEALQDRLGLSAQIPMATPATPSTETTASAEDPGSQGAAGAKQTVVITNSGSNKIQVIKAIREIDQNIGLKEAKDMTENVPVEILKEAKPEDAKAASEKLKAAGATVDIK
jgi:large subunit ribosomal protein L7/L12